MSPTLLPPELQEFVNSQVAHGAFADADAVLIEAVRRMSAEKQHREWVKARIDEAYESIKKERWIELTDEDWDQYFLDLEIPGGSQAITQGK